VLLYRAGPGEKDAVVVAVVPKAAGN